MIHQIVIRDDTENQVYSQNYVFGKCKVKLINCIFVNQVDILFDADSVIDDKIYKLQSQSLFGNIPNQQIFVTRRSDNGFNGLIEVETYINDKIDLTILESDNTAPDNTFDGCVLTVDIIPIA